jgi:hypothetical protein
MLEYDPSRVALYSPQKHDSLFVCNRCSDPQLAIEAARLAYRRAERSPSEYEWLKDALARVGFDAPALFNGAATDAHAFCAYRPEDATALIAFRGTRPDAVKDLVTDVRFQLVDWTETGGRVHFGFATAFRSLYSQIDRWLQLHAAGRGRLIITGHSLGGALATLAASLWKPTLLLTLGSPRVGDAKFVATLAAVPSMRIVGCCDVVTDVPLEISGYRHIEAFFYITRSGQILEKADSAVIATDRRQGHADYLKLHSWKIWKNVASRQLADHAPINYARAFF